MPIQGRRNGLLQRRRFAGGDLASCSPASQSALSSSPPPSLFFFFIFYYIQVTKRAMQSNIECRMIFLPAGNHPPAHTLESLAVGIKLIWALEICRFEKRFAERISSASLGTQRLSSWSHKAAPQFLVKVELVFLWKSLGC